MLRKLMKYEFMAMGRVFLPLFGALIVVSLVNGLLGLTALRVPQGISIAISVLLMISIFVIVYVLTIQRFWTNVLSNEGYLTMTLPVCTDKIILSKLFTAAIWSVASTIVIAVAIIILTGVELDFAVIGDAIRTLFLMAPFSTGETLLFMVQFFVLIIISVFSNILLMYACMSIGILFNKYRALASFGAFVVITTAMQIIGAIFTAIGVSGGLFEAIERWTRGAGTFLNAQLIVLACFVIGLLVCAACYSITRYILKNKLNLQ